MATSRRIETNGVNLHVEDHPGRAGPLLLLHGLSGNARHFGGLAAAGLAGPWRVIAPDLRGRGASDKPPVGYSMADHAADVLGVLDALGLERVCLGGHSFGALLTLFIAAHWPERVERLLLIDGAASLHPRVRELIAPSLARLGESYPSADAYIERIRAMPVLAGFWDPHLEHAFRSEVEAAPGGGVRVRTSGAAVAQSLDQALQEPWPAHLARVRAPALLLRAPEGYGPPGAPPILPEAEARATVRALPQCHYREVTGNHITMLFGVHARGTTAAMLEFLAEAP